MPSMPIERLVRMQLPVSPQIRLTLVRYQSAHHPPPAAASSRPSAGRGAAVWRLRVVLPREYAPSPVHSSILRREPPAGLRHRKPHGPSTSRTAPSQTQKCPCAGPLPSLSLVPVTYTPRCREPLQRLSPPRSASVIAKDSPWMFPPR